jgi:Na+-driven multidrug efflux pump
MVGTNIGAGAREHALRTAWVGAAIAAGLCEAIGLGVATFPKAWLGLFDTDPAMLDVGIRYLQTVGPAYGLFGLGMALYFASQGGWSPVVAAACKSYALDHRGWRRMACAAVEC